MSTQNLSQRPTPSDPRSINQHSTSTEPADQLPATIATESIPQYSDPYAFPFITIPPHIKGILAGDLAQLRSLGQANLNYFLRYWRKEERSLSAELKFLKEALETLGDHTITTIQRLAAQYECPPHIDLKYCDDGTYDSAIQRYLIEPANPTSLPYRHGSTTFNLCGWCEYARGMIQPGDYRLAPVCKLLNRKRTPQFYQSFNTPCLLTHNAQYLQEARAYLNQRRQDLFRYRAHITSVIKCLASCIKDADPDKPILPSCRPSDYFQRDCSIVHFIHKEHKWANIVLPEQQNQLLAGRIVDTYGCDWLKATFPVPVLIDGQDYGHSVNLFARSAHVMKPEDCKYLREHPLYLQTWLNASIIDDPEIEARELAIAIAQSTIS